MKILNREFNFEEFFFKGKVEERDSSLRVEGMKRKFFRNLKKVLCNLIVCILVKGVVLNLYRN